VFYLYKIDFALALQGIEWKTIEYFNNAIICDLIEKSHVGIIALLDEECLRPGAVRKLAL